MRNLRSFIFEAGLTIQAPHELALKNERMRKANTSHVLKGIDGTTLSHSVSSTS